MDDRLHKVIQDAFFEEFGTRPTDPNSHLYRFAKQIVLGTAKVIASDFDAVGCDDETAVEFIVAGIKDQIEAEELLK